jgi:hypothetical protein
MAVTCLSSIRKSYNGYNWVNTYKLVAPDLTAAHNAAKTVIVGTERGMHFTSVAFEYVQTHVINSADPNDLKGSVIAQPGLRAPGGGFPTAPYNALWVQWEAASGRPGKAGYRYCLLNSEVMGVGDKALITPASPVPMDVNEALDEMFIGLSEAGVSMVVGTVDADTGLRGVTNGVVQGIMMLSTRHGWYNRSGGA